MPSTYTLISSNILSSSASTVTFSAIPSTYTDLLLRISARIDTTTENVDIKLNGVASSPSLTYLQGYGSAGLASGRLSAGLPGIRILGADQSGNTANTFGSSEVYIPNYAGSTNKVVSSFAVTETNNTVALIESLAGLASNTAAVSSIQLATGSGNFVTGSSFYLYGIKSS